MKNLVYLALIAVSLMACVPANAWKQDRFIISIWCTPPVEDGPLANAASEGYNLVWAQAKDLDAVGRHGLKALVYDDSLLLPASLDDPEKKSKLDALIDTVKNHPAMEAYYIVDEPGSGAFEYWGRLVSYLRQRDPKHLAYINLLPTYATKEMLGVSADAIEKAKVGIPLNFYGNGANLETVLAYKDYLHKYIEVVKPDLISYDHYHFCKGSQGDSQDGLQYFLNLELIREAAVNAKLPFINIVQSSTFEPYWRLINKDELRFLAYTTMIYGGHGLSYFIYWGNKARGGLYIDGVQTQLGKDAAELNKEMNILGPELLKLTSVGVYHTKDIPFGARVVPSNCPVQVECESPCVIGLFASKTKTDVFMVMNRDYRKNAQLSLTFAKGIKALRVFDRSEGKWEDYCVVKPNKPVKAALGPADGRLFKLIRR